MTDREDSSHSEEPSENSSGFSMKDIADELEAIAGEDAATKRETAESYKSVANTVEADGSAAHEPMRMWVHDSDTGGRLPLMPETMMGLSGGRVSIEQATDELSDVRELVAKKLVEEDPVEILHYYGPNGVTVPGEKENFGGVEPDAATYSSPHKYVRMPDGEKVMGIWSGYRQKTYSMRDQEALGKPPRERVLGDVSFFMRTSDEDMQGAMDAPYAIGLTESGYTASFATANFKLELNDPRNPRNWGPDRMKKYISEQLLPLLDAPGVKQDENGNFEFQVHEGETPAERAHNIAHSVKRSVEDSLEAYAENQALFDKDAKKLKTLLAKHGDQLGEYVNLNPDGEIDLVSAVDRLNIYPDKNMPVNERTQARRQLEQDPEPLREAKILATSMKSYLNVMRYAEDSSKRRINQAEESYDNGFKSSS